MERARGMASPYFFSVAFIWNTKCWTTSQSIKSPSNIFKLACQVMTETSTNSQDDHLEYYGRPIKLAKGPGKT
jgi:hypothetical protein